MTTNAKGLSDCAPGHAHRARQIAPMANDEPFPARPELDLATGESVVTGDDLGEGAVERPMPLFRVRLVVLGDRSDPEIQEGPKRLDPEIGQSQRTILVMPASAKLPAFR